VRTDLNEQFFTTTRSGPSPIPPRTGTRLPPMPSRPSGTQGGTKPQESSTPPKWFGERTSSHAAVHSGPGIKRWMLSLW